MAAQNTFTRVLHTGHLPDCSHHNSCTCTSIDREKPLFVLVQLILVSSQQVWSTGTTLGVCSRKRICLDSSHGQTPSMDKVQDLGRENHDLERDLHLNPLAMLWGDREDSSFCNDPLHHGG